MPTVAIDVRDSRAPQLRGWGRYARELLTALQRHAGDRGIELRPLDGGGPGPELLFEQLWLPRLLRREHADAVHSPNCFLPLRRPCPGIVSVHDLAFEEYPEDFSRRTGWKYRAFAPRAARSAERVICVSEYTRDDLCDRYGVPAERVRVIPEAPALPVGRLEPPEGPYLLAVGDLRRKKNLLRLVEAFRELRSRGLPHRLVLAGLDTGEGARVQEAAGEAPVELTGYVDDARLDALMRGADLVVHPSLYEGFGLVLLEAMARGRPVAAARATALPETGAGAALYFDPLDREEMASTIERAVTDRELHARLAELGRARAAEFSWDATAERTLSVYEEVLP
ncbi:MAG: glycosyltransferase family 4 protein [Solirubrobacteraceae bacterium]